MNKWFIILLIFLFSVTLRFWTINQMGRAWDESEYIEQGYKMIELMKKRDFNNSFFYTTYDHPPLVKYLYGITAHLDVEKHLGNGDVIFRYDLTYSRLLSSILFSLGVGVVVIIGWHIVSRTVGILSGLILTFLPFSLGLSQLVTTESMKIFIYSLAVYSYICLIEKYSIKKLIFAGIVTGLALQVKQSNLLLIPLFFFMSVFYYYMQAKKKRKAYLIKRIAFSLVSILTTSLFIFVLIWPQLILHIKEVYAIHQELWHVQFSPNIWQITLSPPEVFFGRLMLTPIFYYIVYFFISIPVLILVLFFIGLKNIYKSKNWILYSLIFWFAIPFILSFYSWRQHGLRYIIEIYIPLSIIAAIGFNALLLRFKIKEQLKLFYFLPVIFYLSILLFQIKPYFLDYFNELVGGVNTVYKYKLFQLGWWGQGVREASLYVSTNASKDSTVGLAISPIHVSPSMPTLKVEKYNKNKKYDYVIVNYYNVLRERFDDLFIRNSYKPIYFVRADGAVLVTVYKR